MVCRRCACIILLFLAADYMRGQRYCQQAAEGCYEYVVELFATFYLMFDFAKGCYLALILGFDKCHNFVVCFEVVNGLSVLKKHAGTPFGSKKPSRTRGPGRQGERIIYNIQP